MTRTTPLRRTILQFLQIFRTDGRTFISRTPFSEPAEVRFLHQALVLVRHHVRVQLGHEIHHDDDHDQERGAAEVERHTSVTYSAPHTVRRVSTLSIYSPVCWPGRMPGMNAPPFFRFSAVSRELN